MLKIKKVISTIIAIGLIFTAFSFWSVFALGDIEIGEINPDNNAEINAQVQGIISGGIYRIKHTGTNNYLTVNPSNSGNYDANMNNISVSAATGGAEQNFRIVYEDNIYYIKPMVSSNGNNRVVDVNSTNLSQIVSGANVHIFSPGDINSSQWKIEYLSVVNAYVFKINCKPELAMVVNGSNVELGGYHGGLNQLWQFELVSNAEITGIGDNGFLKIGQVKTLSLKINGETVTNYTLTSSDTEIVNINSKMIIGRAAGVAVITAKSGNTVLAEITVRVGYLTPGEYYLRNVERNKYAQIEGKSNADGALLEIWGFVDTNYQKFSFEIQNDAYYLIKSVDSGKYLKVENNSHNNNVDIKQYSLSSYSNADDGFKWRIEETTDKAVKIIPKTGESNNRVMASASGSSNGTNVQQRDFAGYLRNDEWYIVEPSEIVQLIRQEQDQWCWVASAEMASRKYQISSISQSSAAVYIKLNQVVATPTTDQISSANIGGSIIDTEEVLEYFLAADPSFCYSAQRVYSELTLRSLLDDEIPVIITRGWYDSNGNRNGGHATIIYDYYLDPTSNVYMYYIFDPWMTSSGLEIRSYSSICNGLSPVTNYDVVDNGKWEGIITFCKGDYLLD